MLPASDAIPNSPPGAEKLLDSSKAGNSPTAPCCVASPGVGQLPPGASPALLRGTLTSWAAETWPLSPFSMPWVASSCPGASEVELRAAGGRAKSHAGGGRL